jgi:N-sulfoglucosamine sulfohydrolase
MIRSFALSLLLLTPLAAAEKKNVLVLIADDLGKELGCYGDKVAKTPNLDALAASGTRFPNSFASVSSCSPSRATMLTGMPTHQCGQYGLAHATHNASTFKTVKGLPALLNPAGYHTGVVGKLHVQPKEVYPFTEEIADPGRNPVSMAAKAKAFIEGAKEKPFFLWMGYTDPHRAGVKGFANENKYPASVPAIKFDPKTVPVPYHLPDTPVVRQDLAEYYESVARLDHGVGTVLKVLEETKNTDNTLVIFLSDNGIPFAGAKTNLYDVSLNLPFIVRKPGQKAGIVNEAMISYTDLAPTILEWCGVKPSASLLGKSWLPILEDSKPKDWDVVYASHQQHEVTMYYPIRMVRTRTHKLLLNLANGLEYPHASDLWESPTWQSILKDGTTMMGQRSVEQYLRRPKEELYDLTADPNELKNVIDDPKQAIALKELREKLAAWRKATNDPWLIKDKHE